MTDPSTPTPPKALPAWLGVLCMIAGFLAIGSPFVAGATATLLVAVLLCSSGILELIGMFKAETFKCGLFTFLSGALSLVAGGVIFARPLLGMGILTMLIGVYFWMDGIGKVLLALKLKPLPGWGAVLFGGAMTLLLGILIVAKWPLSGVWAIGTLIGVNMLMSGLTIVMVSQVASVTPDAEAAA